MALEINYLKRNLLFKFEARTSRGPLAEHTAYYLRLHHPQYPQRGGVGESAPLQGLSPECKPDFEQRLAGVCRKINDLHAPSLSDLAAAVATFSELAELPSVAFALETALADLAKGGNRLVFRNGFSAGGQGIPINGLIWMGDAALMRAQIREKLEQGYNCLKLKIGGLDFKSECDILREIRHLAGPETLTIRLDANGAFSSPSTALAQLAELTQFTIHSLEQPIRPGQVEEMARVCALSPIPIALDEELIGVRGEEAKTKLIQKIKPSFLILKPTLLGGFSSCREWIRLAEEAGVGWWVTSALESNIGLNAVSQFVAEFDNSLPQGLGTGQLYHNNIGSPLFIRDGCLYYHPTGTWDPIGF
ncbi:o-succinylbenzoate synthase [soil metagenome]